ncbi:MAG: Ig-like domain-containing protein [Caldilineaceae bacterium]
MEGPDTNPPSVTAVSPTLGAFEVAPNSNVTIVFDEPMDPATINGTTLELRDGNNNLVAATVSYDGGSQTATIDPTAPLGISSYAVTVKGGASDPRVKDLAGNALANPYSWSFTTEACATINNRIVCENALPGNPASEWDISGAGDPSIQGYATDISVNLGETVHFKIDTDATDYRIDIYRMGYYDGLGARLQPSSPQLHCPKTSRPVSKIRTQG